RRPTRLRPYAGGCLLAGVWPELFPGPMADGDRVGENGVVPRRRLGCLPRRAGGLGAMVAGEGGRMFWALAGSPSALLVIALGGFVGLWVVRLLAIEAARDGKLEREGKVVKAWVVFANDYLYKKNHPDNWWNALFVCTLEKIPRPDETLEEWAAAIR